MHTQKVEKMEKSNKCQFCIKKLSFYHKLKFSNPYIFVARCHSPLIFRTTNSVRSNKLSLKYHIANANKNPFDESRKIREIAAYVKYERKPNKMPIKYTYYYIYICRYINV